MRARFVLGPAGTGKTFLCLHEIRRALVEKPEGPPLVFLAPKQATFQIERQLLADPALAGYTRLQILSFERLAKVILDELRQPPPPLISEDGRGMVLHALLTRRRKELRAFHSGAGLAGFSRQLSAELRELQRQRFSPKGILDLADRPGLGGSLRHKLRDFSLLLDGYLGWLREHKLQDADCLLDVAADALQKAAPGVIRIDALWLDGFAEMTPQELALLVALAPFCGRMTLAFCVENESASGETSWLSIWQGVGKTLGRVKDRISELPDVEATVEVLARSPSKGRYAASPSLRHFEEFWNKPRPFSAPGESCQSLKLVVCDNPAAEAVMAAREILRFVREGGRYREAAVLVRRIDGYHDELRRVFTRYGIPFFLDRRQAVAHHPLAELTRSSLRAAAKGWQHDDWFGALKSGLVWANVDDIDRLENAALQFGWTGETWFNPLLPEGEKAPWADPMRTALMPAFAAFRKAVGHENGSALNGSQLSKALRRLWTDLEIESRLERWSDSAVHATVWEQMNRWLDDIALAFATVSMPLSQWLPILEAGLGGLSVGVIPPVMDQVLIGAVDRSRNPDLKLALVLGVNEKVFPAAPASGQLLTDSDREELRGAGAELGHGPREFLSREQFLFYIACTRPGERLAVSYSRRDADGQPLNPSWFVSRVNHLFPALEPESFSTADSADLLHACELVGRLAKYPDTVDVPDDLPLDAWRRQRKAFLSPDEPDRLSPGIAGPLYGPALRTSVSRLEQFAACSFRFFIHSGLRAEERQFFELDVKERGSFQHEALKRFHEELQAEKKRWRDITPDQARERMGRIVKEQALHFRAGLMRISAQTRFSARVLAGTLQDFAATLVQWMRQYEFDPVEAELGFGSGDGRLPAWELDLGNNRRLIFRGVIDRIDLCKDGAGSARVVVVDYKSGQKQLDKVLMAHGLQLQLAAYLSVLRHLPDPEKIFGVGRLIPAGVFYVSLRGRSKGGKSRADVLQERESPQEPRYQHLGRFDLEALPLLDNRGEKTGTQFKYRLKNDGTPYANSSDPLTAEQFQALLDQVEEQLVRMGQAIFDGEIGLNPYQKGKDRACDKCDYQSICRFDPWEKPFRILTG